MRIYDVGQRILANCGDRKLPDWHTGRIVEKYNCQNCRPYYIRLDEAVDGQRHWYFPTSCIIDDNRRNRKRKGIPQEEVKE